MADYNALFDLSATEEAMEMGHGEFYEQGRETVKGIERSQDRAFEDLENVRDLDDMER
mgnify:CR=1 FL=1